MKIIIIIMLMFIAMSMAPSFAQAEARVMSQYLSISGEASPISPLNTYTIVAGSSDTYTTGFNVTHSEFQSFSLKTDVPTGTLDTASRWSIQASGVDADGNEYWQDCGSSGAFQISKDELIVLSLPVNGVFRIKFMSDPSYDYVLHICSINRK